MVFIPTFIINILFFATCILAAYQHWRLNRENTVKNLQFVVMVLSILMILVVILYTRHHANPWVSLAFFLIAAGGLCVVIRQQRTLPPSKAFE